MRANGIVAAVEYFTSSPAQWGSAHVIEHGGNALRRPGDRAVDPFPGQQQRALDALLLAQRQERRAQRRRIGKGGKLIERGDGDRFHGRAHNP
jgi:hypothetical protein